MPTNCDPLDNTGQFGQGSRFALEVKGRNASRGNIGNKMHRPSPSLEEIKQCFADGNKEHMNAIAPLE